MSAEDAKDPGEVAAAILKLSNQIQRLAAMVPAEIRDYEVNVGVGTTQTVFLEHRLGNAVRYWIAEWTSSDALPPVRRVAASSDNDTLCLSIDTSTLTGSATLVVRVEPA
jgi:hypothetical protein